MKAASLQGTMIVEQAGFDYEPKRDDYRVLPSPASSSR